MKRSSKTSGKGAKSGASRKTLGKGKMKSVRGGGSTGAGAGKVTFNPFSITKKTDSVSP